MSQASATGMAGGAQPPIIDVWSRTAPKYRIRSVLMLFLLAVLFGGLCCFTYWLRTGASAPWDDERYGTILRQSFNPSGTEQITLSDFLTSPINVQDVPVHIVILGLLFASLSSIPILVAILYRFPVSILFCLMVSFLAAMPWMGLSALAGCALTSAPRLRFSFRYASALLGLVPIGLYFIFASWEPTGGSRVRASQHQALLYAPWVLAMLSSCVICAVGLAVARLINYRPGGISPVLATLFAVPVVVFFLKVGRDELEYRVLEREIGPGGGTLFATISIGDVANRQATRLWSESRSESYDVIRRRMLDQAIAQACEQAEEDRAHAGAMCDSFIERFPKSRYVPNVLFLKGQALDARLNRSKLERQHVAEFRSDWPASCSRQAWRTIAQQFPGSEPDAVALSKLAFLEARDGRIDEAITILDRMIERFDAVRAASRPAGKPDTPSVVFQRVDPSTSLGLDTIALVSQARRFREMLDACRRDRPRPTTEVFGPRHGSGHDRAGQLDASQDAVVHPISLLLAMDESDPRYPSSLEQLALHFPDSYAAGYVIVRRIRLDPAMSRRITGFRSAASALAGRPAGAEALYSLGDVLLEDSLIDEAREALEELIRDYAQSCWAGAARDRLGSLSLRERAAST